MTRRVGALVVAMLLALLEANAEPAKVAVGAAFPSLDADSVTGKHVVLPADRRGTPFVVIFGFSRKAGEASAQWSQALHRWLPPAVDLYAVADLSRVPGLFRGFVVSAIRRGGAPLEPRYRDHLLLLTRGNDWARIVPSGSDDDPVVVAVDPTGTVAAVERRPSSDAAALDLATTLRRRLPDAAPSR